MHWPCRSGEQRGRANPRSGAQENFCHTDANTAPKKEKYDRDEKEIAYNDTDGNSVTDLIHEEKTFTGNEGKGIAYAIAQSFPEKETNSDRGREFTKCDCFTAPKEKAFSNTPAV